MKTQKTFQAQDDSYLGNNSSWKNGQAGPFFAWPLDIQKTIDKTSQWPEWQEKLQLTQVQRIAEGGARTHGHNKQSTATMPLVSYVTVVKNSVKTVARAIESVQKQTYKNVEHIILDAASTDGTLDIVKSYDQLLDYFASEEDSGIYYAMNKAIPLARGQLICMLNADDWLEPEAAEIAVRNIGDTSKSKILSTSAKVYRHGHFENFWRPQLIHPGQYFTFLRPCHNGMYVTRKAYETSGEYDTSFVQAADSQWLMTCLEKSTTFLYTYEATVNYELGGHSSNFLRGMQENIRIMKERFTYISECEAQMLYSCFCKDAAIAWQSNISLPTNLDNMCFLKCISQRYAHKQNFLYALSWAAIDRLQHPYEPLLNLWEASQKPLPFRQRVVTAIQILLYGNARLYNIATLLYRRIFKRFLHKDH